VNKNKSHYQKVLYLETRRKEMRSALLIVVILSLLIVGVLVIKDMESDTGGGVSKQAAIEKAEKVADDAERASEAMKKTMSKLDQTVED
jgi:hypothetical protein